jgi:hypothetical protein
MEIQSCAGPSCAILPTSTQAPRADVRLSEDRPAKRSAACTLLIRDFAEAIIP